MCLQACISELTFQSIARASAQKMSHTHCDTTPLCLNSSRLNLCCQGYVSSSSKWLPPKTEKLAKLGNRFVAFCLCFALRCRLSQRGCCSRWCLTLLEFIQVVSRKVQEGVLLHTLGIDLRIDLRVDGPEELCICHTVHNITSAWTYL